MATKTQKKSKTTVKKSKTGSKAKKKSKISIIGIKEVVTSAKVVQKVHAAFILDKSGSMFVRQHPTIEGFNEYLTTLKNDQGAEYLFSLTLFDNEITTAYTAEALANVAKLDQDSYKPGGNTALYDAIGTTIHKISEGDKADKMLVIIMTDGQENASLQYSQHQIFKLIKEKENLGNWSFVFLGCDSDAYEAGFNLGISPGSNLKYNQQDMKGTMAYAAASTVAYSNANISMTRDISALAPSSKSVRSYKDVVADTAKSQS